MLLTIRHNTHYRFSHPARYTIQYLRLTPRSDPNQQVVRWRLETPGRRNGQIDPFGNVMHVMVVDTLHEEVAISVSGEVLTEDTAGVTPGLGDPLPPIVYLRPTPLTEPGDAVMDFAAPLRAAIDADRLDGLHQLSHAVAGAVAYRQGGTDVDTPAADVLKAGAGVCQDQAHVFIAAARALGIPTRYVSGYVHVAGEQLDETASHAWAESWVADLGWVAFDVTNEICANDAHVRLAVGPDYLACAPVRGVRRGGGEEQMAVTVSVTAAEQ